MEFISLNVRTLRFLRNFHTVLPRNRTSLHSLQPCRRFPDLQASSAFIISGLFANCYSDWHEVMHHCSFVCISYSFALVSIFHSPLASKRASCPTQAQQLWRTGLVAPKHVENSWTRDPAHGPCTVRWTLHHWVASLFSLFSF